MHIAVITGVDDKNIFAKLVPSRRYQTANLPIDPAIARHMLDSFPRESI
jgi:hypothetical protein